MAASSDAAIFRFGEFTAQWAKHPQSPTTMPHLLESGSPESETVAHADCL